MAEPASTDRVSMKGRAHLPYRDASLITKLDELSIFSERLFLRLIRESNAEDVFSGFTRDLAKYMTPEPAGVMSHTLSFIRSVREEARQGTDLQLCMYRTDNSEFLGCLGLHGRSDPACPEIGLWVKKSAHGNRYGLEGARALKAWAEENLVGLRSFLYPVGAENVASRKIAEGLGGEIQKSYMSSRAWAPEFEMLLYHIPAAKL